MTEDLSTIRDPPPAVNAGTMHLKSEQASCCEDNHARLRRKRQAKTNLLSPADPLRSATGANKDTGWVVHL
jgi:hypothetical protein